MPQCSPIPLLIAVLIAGLPGYKEQIALAEPANNPQLAIWSLRDGENEPFSAFVVEGVRGMEMITAHHGPTVRQGCKASSFDPKVKGSPSFFNSKKAKRIQFLPASAGDCNYGHDATKISFRLPSSFLKVAPFDFNLKKDEPVTISGFPSGKYRGHHCALSGIRPSLNNGALAHYVLDCHGLNYDIGGMSGGPVILRGSGLVIGLVNAQGDRGAAGFNRVYVTPVSRGSSGEIVFGIRKKIDSANCFNNSGRPSGYCGVDASGRLVRGR